MCSTNCACQSLLSEGQAPGTMRSSSPNVDGEVRLCGSRHGLAAMAPAHTSPLETHTEEWGPWPPGTPTTLSAELELSHSTQAAVTKYHTNPVSETADTYFS